MLYDITYFFKVALDKNICFQNDSISFSGQQLLEVQKYGNGGKGHNGAYPISNVFSQDGYPGPIEKGFPGIPDSVDAAFLWGGNDRIYFFKVIYQIQLKLAI